MIKSDLTINTFHRQPQIICDQCKDKVIHLHEAKNVNFLLYVVSAYFFQFKNFLFQSLCFVPI